jgi:hypothetical protein
MMEMPMKNEDAFGYKSFRQMAIECRKMAAVSRRPGPLLMRAEAYDARATEIELRQNGPQIREIEHT